MIALLALAAALGAWQLYTVISGVDPLFLPAPSDVAHALYSDRSLLFDQWQVSAKEIALGLAVGLAAAALLAAAMHASKLARRGLYPLLVATQTIPIVTLAPVLVFWLGFGTGPKLAIIAVVSFFPIVVPVLDQLAAVDRAYPKMLKTLGATPLRSARLVDVPFSVPGLLTGAKLAVAFAAIADVLAESSGSTSGLGTLITQSQANLDTARAFAAVAVLSLTCLALFGALALFERAAVPWARSEGSPA